MIRQFLLSIKLDSIAIKIQVVLCSIMWYCRIMMGIHCLLMLRL